MTTKKVEQLKLPEPVYTDLENVKEGWKGVMQHVSDRRKKIIVKKTPSNAK